MLAFNSNYEANSRIMQTLFGDMEKQSSSSRQKQGAYEKQISQLQL